MQPPIYNAMIKPTARFTRLSAAERRSSLIAAALECMSEVGLAGFTVDRISEKAGVSRGLITHHFGSMAGLMTAVYAHLYAEVIPTSEALPAGPGRLAALIDHLFDPKFFNRHDLNMWLTMWGAIANTPELMEEHRSQYDGYIQMVADAIKERAPVPDACMLAKTFICLVDGLSLQHCIDPPSMPADMARQAAVEFLESRFRSL